MISTLFVFSAIVGLIFAIARICESNKLFWTLLVPFLVGFSVVEMTKSHETAPQEENIIMQESPTQAALPSSDTTMYLLAGDSVNAPKKETSEPVSQDSFAKTNEVSSSSKIAIKTRDQPLETITHDTS